MENVEGDIQESFQKSLWQELPNVEGEGQLKEEPKVCRLNG